MNVLARETTNVIGATTEMLISISGKRVISSKIRSVSGSNGYSSPSSMLSVNLTLNNLLIGSTCSSSYSKC